MNPSQSTASPAAAVTDRSLRCREEERRGLSLLINVVEWNKFNGVIRVRRVKWRRVHMALALSVSLLLSSFYLQRHTQTGLWFLRFRGAHKRNARAKIEKGSEDGGRRRCDEGGPARGGGRAHERPREGRLNCARRRRERRARSCRTRPPSARSLG